MSDPTPQPNPRPPTYEWEASNDVLVERAPETAAEPLPFKHFQQGQRLGERFEILELLGSGGMGAVFRARDLSSGREVALKTLIDHESGRRLQRFWREGEVIIPLFSHRNVLATLRLLRAAAGDELGVDPFGDGTTRLRQRREPTRLVLWSVGSDGIDDGGHAPVDARGFVQHGDLILVVPAR